MRRVFADYPEAANNTVRIAERINLSLDVKGYHLPNFPVPEGTTLADHLAKVARAGLERRLKSMEHLFAAKRKKHEVPEYWERLDDVIQREPIEPQDIFFHAMVRPLGLEKGKSFEPDARQTKILTEAALVGEAMAKANSAERRFTN